MSAAAAGTEVDVLRGAHEHLDARHARHFRTHAIDELLRGHVTIAAILHHDEDAAARHARIAHARADHMRDRLHRRILRDDIGDLLLLDLHVLVGDVIGTLGGGEDERRVLQREEAFGNEDVADDRERDGRAEADQHRALMRQRPFQATVVLGNQAL